MLAKNRAPFILSFGKWPIGDVVLLGTILGSALIFTNQVFGEPNTSLPPAATPAPSVVTIEAPSPVILAEDSQLVQRFSVDSARTERTVDQEILKLTSATDIGTAWARLGIQPTDVVGVKICCAGGPLMATHRPIIGAICRGLHSAGVPYEHIYLWDKNGSTMALAGYSPTDSLPTRVGVTNVFPNTGYDPDVTYKDELSGELIWGDSDFIRGEDTDIMQSVQNALNKDSHGSVEDRSLRQMSNVSHFANLITHTFTKIVNVPVVTDSEGLGISGCLASLALASVDNNRRFQGPPTYGDPAIGAILAQPFYRRKVVLNVLDAMIVQYAGGPEFNPQFCESPGAIYVGRDAVAIDTLVLPRLEAWRHAHHVDPIGITAAHIHGCTLPKLGTDNLHRIQLIRL